MDDRYPVPAAHDIRLTDVLRALGDPARVQIVEQLADGEAHSGDFGLELQKSTISHHLRALREAGLTRTEQVGRECFVTLRRDELDERFPGLLTAVTMASARES